ncbi:MAG: hypothetical protein J6C63_05170 [Lachnospiraceae bacterium]|nr:hypothetical protein [Lachnospiraceae bacterium]
MSVKERVLICRLLEKMSEQEAYSRQLGLENASTFCGVNIIQKKNEEHIFSV